MEMMDILGKSGGLQSISRELGLNESEAESGAAALLPAILGGFKKQTLSHPEGVEGVGGLLGQLGGGGLMDNVLSPQPTDLSQGDSVLGHIFGSKDVSRAVAQNAASRSGLNPSVLQKMLPMLAMVVGGYMSKQRGIGGGMPGAGGLFGLAQGQQGQRGRGGLASMLDLDGDGNALDDIMRMVAGRR